MKYVGMYNDFNLPSEGKLLVCYIDNIEIFIRYDGENPLQLTQIAILLESSEYMTLYDVFQCEYHATDEVDAKAYVKSFAELLIKYREKYGRYLKNLKNRQPLK